MRLTPEQMFAQLDGSQREQVDALRAALAAIARDWPPLQASAAIALVSRATGEALDKCIERVALGVQQ